MNIWILIGLIISLIGTSIYIYAHLESSEKDMLTIGDMILYLLMGWILPITLIGCGIWTILNKILSIKLWEK